MSQNDTPELFNKIVEYLKGFKTEINKRDVVYEYGIDLINYNNGYTVIATSAVTNLISILYNNKYNIESIKDTLEWWLYERVEKQFFVKNKEGIETTINVEDPVEFLKSFTISCEDAWLTVNDYIYY